MKEAFAALNKKLDKMQGELEAKMAGYNRDRALADISAPVEKLTVLSQKYTQYGQQTLADYAILCGDDLEACNSAFSMVGSHAGDVLKATVDGTEGSTD